MWIDTHVMVDGHIVAIRRRVPWWKRSTNKGFERFLNSIQEGDELTMKEKTYVEDIDRSMYDFRDEEKDAYRVR